MILMIDNYDSFTFNLVQFLGELGQELVVKRNDEVSIADIENMKPDFLMISPDYVVLMKRGLVWKLLNTLLGRFRFWSLSWASIDCTSIWWRSCSCRAINAWKNVTYAS